MRVVLSAALVKAERDLTLSGPAASAVIISVARSTAILASFRAGRAHLPGHWTADRTENADAGCAIPRVAAAGRAITEEGDKAPTRPRCDQVPLCSSATAPGCELGVGRQALLPAAQGTFGSGWQPLTTA